MVVSNGEFGYEDYVCSRCFRTLEDCVCEYHPWNLVNIDRNIQEQVRILNEKGYRTKCCCESHSPNNGIYISFQFGCEPDNMPDGFVLRKNNAMYHTYKGDARKSWELYEKDKEKYLNVLLDWCIDLPRRDIARGNMALAAGNALLPA